MVLKIFGIECEFITLSLGVKKTFMLTLSITLYCKLIELYIVSKTMVLNIILILISLYNFISQNSIFKLLSKFSELYNCQLPCCPAWSFPPIFVLFTSIAVYKNPGKPYSSPCWISLPYCWS